jgi:hypothetical protein
LPLPWLLSSNAIVFPLLIAWPFSAVAEPHVSLTVALMWDTSRAMQPLAWIWQPLCAHAGLPVPSSSPSVPPAS